MIRRVSLAAALAAALLALPGVSRAAESPRSGSFDLGVIVWSPNMDAGFNAPQPGTEGAGPWQQMYGAHRRGGFRAGISRTLLTGFGSLDLGFRTGYMQAEMKGFENTGTATAPVWTRSSDTTAFRIIPTSLALTYRFDFLADRYNVPFAPYARVGLDRYNWWITNGSGGTAKKGATNGWSVAGGLAFMLDFLDPGRGRELDREVGINHTYLFAEISKAKVNDFGSSKSFDLSDRTFAYSGGLLFVF